MKRLLALLLLLPLLSTAPSAQTLYNVRVGTFQDVRADEFDDLRELGFVYGRARDGQLTDVYLGNFTTRERASTVATRLQDRGFRNATPLAIPVAASGEDLFVQIALRARNRRLDWPAMERAGKLYVDAADGVIKVVTGPFGSEETAEKELARIRELGYGDAFVRTIARGNLVPVGVFETGIKKPLIPINLGEAPPPPPARRLDTTRIAPTTTPAAPTPAPAREMTEPEPGPEPMGEEAVARNPAPAASASTIAPPEIDGKTKRHSSAELQRVLKEKGYYSGSLDGYYGPGTATAYRAAWTDMDELQKYHLLSAATEPPAGAAGSWPEVRVLAIIADDLAAGTGNADRRSADRDARAGLLASIRTLPSAEADSVREWEETTWENLTQWATEDPLHAVILSAFRVAYFQSQVRLEVMYQSRGLGAIAARDLATAALRNMLAADLERFE